MLRATDEVSAIYFCREIELLKFIIGKYQGEIVEYEGLRVEIGNLKTIEFENFGFSNCI